MVFSQDAVSVVLTVGLFVTLLFHSKRLLLRRTNELNWIERARDQMSDQRTILCPMRRFYILSTHYALTVPPTHYTKAHSALAHH